MRPHHLLLCLTAAFTLGAQEPAPRIAVLVPERIVENTARGKKLFAELDALRKSLDDRIQAKRAEIQKLASQLQSPSISDAGKETIQKQLRDLDFEGKKIQDDSQMEFQRTQQRVVGQFQQELGPLVDDLAKEQKLQMVLTYQPGLVAYMDQAWGLSFTDEVGRRYDAKYAAGAPAPAAKPAAGAPKPATKPAAPKAAPKAAPAP